MPFLSWAIASVSSESRRLGGLPLSRMCGRDSSDTMLGCSMYSPLAIRSCRLHSARRPSAVRVECPTPGFNGRRLVRRSMQHAT